MDIREVARQAIKTNQKMCKRVLGVRVKNESGAVEECLCMMGMAAVMMAEAGKMSVEWIEEALDPVIDPGVNGEVVAYLKAYDPMNDDWTFTCIAPCFVAEIQPRLGNDDEDELGEDAVYLPIKKSVVEKSSITPDFLVIHPDPRKVFVPVETLNDTLFDPGVHTLADVGKFILEATS